MRKMINQHGDDFYALTFDFKGFFDSIPHITCYNVLNKNYNDSRVTDLIMQIVKSYMKPNIMKIKDEKVRNEELCKLENNMQKGICLGSEISQILALVVPNDIDHYIKDRQAVKHYIRYMDDGIIFHKDKKYLQELFEGMKKVCENLGLVFNEKKTRIVKASKGFTFLKIKYRVRGRKLIKSLSRSGITRMRRKLKKFRKLVDRGKMSLDDVFISMQAWLGHSKLAKSYHTVKRMLRLYDELFGGYRITKKYFRNIEKGGNKNEVLQDNRWSEFRWDCDESRAA